MVRLLISRDFGLSGADRAFRSPWIFGYIWLNVKKRYLKVIKVSLKKIKLVVTAWELSWLIIL